MAPAPSAYAFTLIELLVVIGIIALLAALIFPAISSAQRTAKQTQSLNNLKAWAGAFTLAVADFDQDMPSDGGAQFKIEDDTAWYNRMPPKISLTPLKKAQIQDLPKIGEKSPWINPGATDTFGGTGVPFCYGYNDYLSTTTEPTIKITRVTYTSKTILMAEKKVSDPSPAVSPENIQFNFGAKDPADMEALANVVFIDGHGEAVSRKVLLGQMALKADTEEDHRQAQITWLPFEKAQK